MSGKEQVDVPTGYAGGEKYYVEKLVGKRILKSGEVEYLVKWWGWEWETNTWESSEMLLEDCPQLVKEYEEGKKGKEAGRKQNDQERHRNPTPAAVSDAEKGKERRPQAENADAVGDDDGGDSGGMVQDSENEHSGAVGEIVRETRSRKRQAPLGDEKEKMKKAKTNGGPSSVPGPMKVSSKQGKKVDKKQSPKQKKSRKTNVQDGKLKYIPESILGVTEDNVTREIQFLIKWKGMDVANLVPATRARIGCPQLVIAFYERHLIFRGDYMEVEESNLDDETESEESDEDYEDGAVSDFDWKIRG